MMSLLVSLLTRVRKLLILARKRAQGSECFRPWCAEDFFQLPQSWEAPRRKQAEIGVGEEFTLLSVNENRNQLEYPLIHENAVI